MKLRVVSLPNLNEYLDAFNVIKSNLLLSLKFFSLMLLILDIPIGLTEDSDLSDENDSNETD